MLGVLPACAGVILEHRVLNLQQMRFTRMRGGDPHIWIVCDTITKFYPHARG